MLLIVCPEAFKGMGYSQNLGAGEGVIPMGSCRKDFICSRGCGWFCKSHGKALAPSHCSPESNNSIQQFSSRDLTFFPRKRGAWDAGEPCMRGCGVGT